MSFAPVLALGGFAAWLAVATMRLVVRRSRGPQPRFDSVQAAEASAAGAVASDRPRPSPTQVFISGEFVRDRD